jgi:hypothetical protein
MTPRLLIAVYRPYSSLHGGKYTITRLLSRIDMYNQYFIGKVKETSITDMYGLAYEMRTDKPAGYEHASYPLTDRDIHEIKKGIAWHKANSDNDCVIWVESVTTL